MTVYLLDTNHVSDMLRKRPVILKKVADMSGKGTLNIAMTSVAELWYMVFNSARVQQNSDDLNQVLEGLTRSEFSEAAAVEFGRIKAELRKKGRTIPDSDTQIAAIARINDLTILTADSHFSYIADLKTENWLS
jgi:tRNA(fMet)-specific endonuclease VapC